MRIVNSAQRRAETEKHDQAIATTNDMFDQLAELVEARDRPSGVAPLGPPEDPIETPSHCSTTPSSSTTRSGTCASRRCPRQLIDVETTCQQTSAARRRPSSSLEPAAIPNRPA
jgi:hypothetical protein